MLLRDAPRRSTCTLLLAHGAGAPMDSPFMSALAAGLAALGVAVMRFEFPYMARLRTEGTRAPPDRMPVLEAHFLAVAAALPRRKPLFVGGKSMGSRVAVKVADRLGARGVIALGYPFHPPGRPERLRTEALAALRAPCLVVQGARDALGDRSEVAGYALPPTVRVHWLEDGDHSFAPRQASGRALIDNLAEAACVAAAFMRTLS